MRTVFITYYTHPNKLETRYTGTPYASRIILQCTPYVFMELQYIKQRQVLVCKVAYRDPIISKWILPLYSMAQDVTNDYSNGPT